MELMGYEEALKKTQQGTQGADPQDARLWVKFHMEAVLDDAASTAEGRPIFREEEFVTIMAPGDRDNIVVERVHAATRQRFPTQYSKWKETGAEAIQGTPLAAWPAVTKAQVEELRYFGVRTVEELAAMSDANSGRFMGIKALQMKAQAFLAAAAGNAPVEKMRVELSKRDEQIESMQRTLQEQADKIEALLQKAKR
jgi:hypothetical protein